MVIQEEKNMDGHCDELHKKDITMKYLYSYIITYPAKDAIS